MGRSHTTPFFLFSHGILSATERTIQSSSKRLRDCTIATEPERAMRKEHALSERVEWVPPRFRSRDARKSHAQSVYLFEKDCTFSTETGYTLENT
ncbi:hypothetical protein Y032_0008g252 [Ancylostoma ceylanicum]|uniref:Uncharacterized protein n=1 Tax=Ancylostoma ceylanicum TaxID=53326 RepID=A0A016VLL7_9BILA|nr:hypothetical protein Y032_0008g252 [Ancylostoma ceylanicum]